MVKGKRRRNFKKANITHRGRLLRKILNFVFLRTLLYDGTACEQKTKNAKIAANSMFAAIFFELCCYNALFQYRIAHPYT